MIMAIQIVMDHTGDTRHPFNPNDAQALAKAEERFKKLTGLGFTAAVRTASGGGLQGSIIRSERRRNRVLSAAGRRLVRSADHVPVSTISARGSHAYPCPVSALPES